MNPLALSPPAAVPTARFLLSHPAHFIALGAGSGLSPLAPGTVGTLWSWLAFAVLQPWMTDARWAVLLVAGIAVGGWACTVTARDLGVADPTSIVWDEIVSFWVVLWLVTPAGFGAQFMAFLLFRAFDTLKPGPIGWADGLFKGDRRPIGWRQGVNILFDDLLAAFCTLLVIALWSRW
jgi:phosphatidylglycerophosphatase A